LISPAYIYLTAAKFLIFFFLIFIFIPSRFIRFQNEDGFLDRVFISLTHMVALTIILVHILAFLKLYETLSLIFAYFLTYLGIVWWRGNSAVNVADALGMKTVVNILDMADGADGLKEGVRKYITGRKEVILAGLPSAMRWFMSPFEGFLPVTALFYSAYLRFDNSFRHAYFGASDCYVHLAWVKYLGSNQIYKDGIYSYGYHAVISSVEKLTLLDPYMVMRFIGPLGGFLLVFAIYYFVYKISRSYPAALLSSFIFGAGAFSGDVWRQISALPQEFSGIFFLPGIYYAWRYLEKGHKYYLLLFGECVAITLWIHLYAAVYLVLGSGIACIAAIFTRTADIRRFAYFTTTGIAGSFLGVMPLGIGMLTGKEFHGSLGYIKKSINAGAEGMPSKVEINGHLIDTFLTGNVFIDGSFFISIFMIIASIILLIINKKRENVIFGSFSLFTLVMYFMSRAETFGLPLLMDPVRTSSFFSMAAAVIAGLGVYYLFNLVPKIKNNLVDVVYKLTVLLVVFMIGYNYHIEPPEGGRMEYDGGVNAYILARQSLPALNWNIISPVEQYSQVLGKGWHYEIWEFVYKYCLVPEMLNRSWREEASDKNFSLKKAQDLEIEDGKVLEAMDKGLISEGNKIIRKIKDPYIIFYTEKKPLGLGRETEEKDLNIPIPMKTGNPTETYYYNPEIRAGIEARARAWIEEYGKAHDNISTFYEDEEMKIYLIKQ